jgi:hypothetical protein
MMVGHEISEITERVYTKKDTMNLLKKKLLKLAGTSYLIDIPAIFINCFVPYKCSLRVPYTHRYI